MKRIGRWFTITWIKICTILILAFHFPTTWATSCNFFCHFHGGAEGRFEGVGEILAGAWSWVRLNFIVTTVHVMLWLPVMPLGYLTLMQHIRLQDLTAVLISCYVNILLCSLRETPPTNNCCTPVGFGVNIAEVFEWWQVSGARLLYLHCCCSISRICLSCWVVCTCIWAVYQTLRGLW